MGEQLQGWRESKALASCYCCADILFFWSEIWVPETRTAGVLWWWKRKEQPLKGVQGIEKLEWGRRRREGSVSSAHKVVQVLFFFQNQERSLSMLNAGESNTYPSRLKSFNYFKLLRMKYFKVSSLALWQMKLKALSSLTFLVRKDYFHSSITPEFLMSFK